MKIINVEQGTQQWLDWRKTIITATECPVILGSSPWQSVYQCWQRKLNLIPPQETNKAMEEGKRLEPIARALFIEETGINMAPICVESTVHEFLGASLDGISDCHTYILEIKCGGEKLFNMAEQGIIPSHYMDQMQHQLLVTDAELCYYYCFYNNQGICIEVKPDPLFYDRFLPKAKEFWRCYIFSEAPPLSKEDYFNMDENTTWYALSNEYQEIDATIKSLEKNKEEIRKKLIDMCDNKNAQGNGLKVMNVMTKGRVAYEEIAELKQVNLDKFRKNSSYSWKIMIAKESLIK